MSVSDLSDGRLLRPFVELARTLDTAPALIGLVQDVLSVPDVYVFGELLQDSNFQTVLSRSQEGQRYLSLLQTFAYGTFKDYRDNEHLPRLSPAQELKLKRLTLVSLASKNRSISYDELMSTLEIALTRELEDLIIESIYLGLCTGKLNPARRRFEVDETFGRDVRPSDLTAMRETLVSWCEQSRCILDSISARIGWISAQRQTAAIRKEQCEHRIGQMLAKLNSSAACEKKSGGPSLPKKQQL